MQPQYGFSSVKALFVAFLCALMPVLQLSAETERIFRHLSVEDGLANDRVYAVVQDQTGFMWFGTEGGLNRYDGNRIVEFHHDPDVPESLSDEDVSFIHVGRNGVL